MKKIISFILIIIISVSLFTACVGGLALKSVTKKSEVNDKNQLTYKNGVEAANYAFSGMQFNLDKKTQLPNDAFNYLTNSSEAYVDFYAGLSTISAYTSTGDVKYLNFAKKAGNFLADILPSDNIVPQYCDDGKLIANAPILTGTNGQASILELVAYLARYDTRYLKLMNRLATGLITYCINPANNLAWDQINTSTGKVIKSPDYGYETLLGSHSVSCAEALLAAYETEPSQQLYKNKALSILKSIWECRNKSNNLIAEAYDVMNNKVGKCIYPYNNYRYDDMGGVYLRGLQMAYLITEDKEIYKIARTYIPSLINATWEDSLDGGAFRYLTNLNGQPYANYVETMHGLFIATLLEANSIFYDNSSVVINKCIKNAKDTIINNFAVKNDMCPHQVNKDGKYVNKQSDSQLGYSVIQYPLGYELLSQVTEDNEYRDKSNKIVKTLLERYKIGDNIKTPKGYINILETTPPYGFEKDYSTPRWMYQAFYIPAYLLFNSVHASKSVKIDWYHGNPPGVFGLVSDMPFWDNSLVKISGNRITFEKVTGEGTIDFSDLGYKITEVLMDGKEYKHALEDNILTTKAGCHKYEIVIKNH